MCWKLGASPIPSWFSAALPVSGTRGPDRSPSPILPHNSQEGLGYCPHVWEWDEGTHILSSAFGGSLAQETMGPSSCPTVSCLSGFELAAP